MPDPIGRSPVQSHYDEVNQHYDEVNQQCSVDVVKTQSHSPAADAEPAQAAADPGAAALAERYKPTFQQINTPVVQDPCAEATEDMVLSCSDVVLSAAQSAQATLEKLRSGNFDGDGAMFDLANWVRDAWSCTDKVLDREQACESR